MEFSKLEALLEGLHKDVEYLKNPDISLVISKALSETFKAKPLEPKKYFAKYLLNVAASKREERQVSLSEPSINHKQDLKYNIQTYNGLHR